MPFTIPNTTSTDFYQRFGNGLYVGGWIQVLQQTGTTSTGGVYAFCTTKPGGPSGPIADQEIVQLTPGWYPLQGSAANPIVSVSFKSAVAGQPCQVFGVLYEANASGFGAGTSVSSTISASGSVTGGTSNMIYSSVRMTGTQSLTSGTPAAVQFGAAILDPYTLWSNTNPTRLTINSAGTYKAWFDVLFATSGSGTIRQAYILKNGSTTTDYGYIAAVPNANFVIPLQGQTQPMSLAVGDYLELYANQDTGGLLNLRGDLSPSLQVYIALQQIA